MLNSTKTSLFSLNLCLFLGMGFVSSSAWCAETSPAPAAKSEAPAVKAAAVAEPTAKLPSVEELLKQAADAGDEPVWSIAENLALAGKGNIEALTKAAGDANVNVALAGGYALLKAGEARIACDALAKLVKGNASLARRVDAAAAIGCDGGEYAANCLYDLLRDQSLPERLQAEVAKSLWKVNRSVVAKDALSRLLQAKSESARTEAALALAAFAPASDLSKLLQTLVFKHPGADGDRAKRLLLDRAQQALKEGEFDAVAPMLRELASRPGLDPGMAKLLLSVSSGVDASATQDRFAVKLTEELIDMIRKYYAPNESGTPDQVRREHERLEGRRLAESGAKALVGSIDPFSSYLDEDDLTQMRDQIDGHYGGIGAWVGMVHRRFTIITPMYGQPAFQAGLRSMDWIEKIDGKEIKDLTLGEIIKLLKGDDDTKVTLLVWRKNWTKAREFVVTRRIIDVPSVKGRMLPGGVGFIRISSFSKDTSVRLEEKVRDLNKAGMKALVLDLSDNPGGLLISAVEVCSLFLPKGTRVVSSAGKPDVHPEVVYNTQTSPIFPDLPMAVLVNSGSASASEIVSGCLQDHKRATLVGEKTFGKGSVQQLFPIRLTGQKTQLKLTIAKYYLPNGRCIHNVGIDPDFTETAEAITEDAINARLKLRDTQRPVEYVRRLWPTQEKLFRQLFEYDAEKPESYPEFEAFKKEVAQLELGITDQDLRREIRWAIRLFLESERGEEIGIDPEENVYLQRAVLEMAKKMGNGIMETPLYGSFKANFDDRERKRLKLEAEQAGTNDGPGSSPREGDGE